jgi:hypothetical protein
MENGHNEASDLKQWRDKDEPSKVLTKWLVKRNKKSKKEVEDHNFNQSRF